MHIFSSNCYSKVYNNALYTCYKEGNTKESRVGNTLDLGPVCFEVQDESAGLPFLAGRGLNIFFALAELAWIIQGSEKLAPLKYFIKNYDQYSDDKKTLNGAYGFRIFNKFKINQLELVVNELKKNKDSRRAVISLFSPNDLDNLDSLDIPCNMSLLFKIRNNSVDLTIFNRSNDVFKGIPYNFLVFKFFQYYVAKELGFKIGVHRHITDSLHLYNYDKDKVQKLLNIPLNNKHKSIDISIFDDILENSYYITNMEWDKIEDKRLRSFFMSYQYFREDFNLSHFDTINIDDELYFYVQDWLISHNLSRN